ncbi:structural maintenance of chromosomes protein 2-like isoform X1 [Ixodes scapularis]|uniref:structural maintenance of chromosomes protein 2-like isoform X1 n=1 Tax=Ixodes scapularis TaxID=6945 RepID=UPI001C388471|nr:structural maintenance of chromosomes protein 2-like isoform X1 [Ixodes scapularis]
MHIKSITIDGFKSYGQRVDINGFDNLFNAITGLNGSGKSNILDSICFVLGITNLSQVRASNLQDLVYKNGQAGVTKATVSITFDNRDTRQRPVGYEHFEEFTISRQVVVGGRNKYMINGVTATTNRVQDLFRSVQLNVNNPHFLIMQGRITKVLNMKPPEILSMIEEAAGTRMYESKKQVAQKTIEKKDAKIAELNNVLAEEITPTIEKLKEERQAYLAYTKVSRELDHLTKLYIAWQYVETENGSQQSGRRLEETKAKISKSHTTIDEINAKTKDIGKEIAELERRRKEETGDRLDALEKELKEKQLEETKVNSDIQFTKDQIKGEAKNQAGFKKNMDEDNAALVSKQKQADKLQATVDALAESSQKDAEAVAAANKHFRAVTAGLSSNADGEEATITEQLRAAKSDIAEAVTAMRQAEMDLKHSQEESKKKQAECRKTESSYQKDDAANKAIEKDINLLKAQMSKLNYEEGKEEALLSQKQQLQREVNTLSQKVDVFEARNQHLSFHYTDPVKNFDRRKVLGLVCDLFTIKDKRAARALEMAAGGKLFNVVVDTEETGKLLLKSGRLKRRVTIIPLNKIVGRDVEPTVMKKAESLVGKDKVFSALSLVDFTPVVASAMKYVFGTTLVTTNMDDARVVAFDSGVQKRTVSFDGASFDPSGVVSGGAVARGPSTLEQVAVIQQDRKALAEATTKAVAVAKELAGIQKVSHTYNKLKAEFELKETELEQLRSRLQQSTHHQLLQEFNALQKSIEESKAKLESCKEVEKRATAKVKDLEEKVKDSKNIRERELKAAEQQIAQCKKRADESSKKFAQKKQEAEGLQLEIEELQKCLTGYNAQLEVSNNTLKDLEQALANHQQKLAGIKEQVSKANEDLKAQKEKLKAASREIGAKYTERDGLQKKADDLKLKIQQWEHDISKVQKEAEDARRKLEDLVKHYEWIPSEKQYFGQANTEYDFTVNNPVEAGRRIQKLSETKEKLGQNVNSRAQNQLLKAEEKYQDLSKKKRTVLADKAKIMTVIKELDEKKSLALKAAWKKVNKDFGSIFSTLLPGTNAKLEPPDNMDVLDGLEVKVAFGGVWKESLQELSGGQRSLVALSLILSLLLFNPAPIYILDEVDAALDLSHTQNIGQMLRTHFRQSQFIVVSLKEGMFNNANVLFRTKCVNGMSSVTRTAQRLELDK